MKKEMEEVEEGKEKTYDPRRLVVGDRMVSRQLPAGNPRPTLEKSVAPTALAMSVGSVPSPYGLG